MTDPQFSTISMVLPREVVADINAFARERGRTRGALLREGLRRLGVPVPEDDVLGFSEAPAPTT
ncbi:CopG family transcriptional regulator [Roseococcus sp.]|uniref:ribbon-helix-helix domain-containing protein n=1 Tax=Roseococcus sp. TaxID=2109646 RepID=UPI003BAA8BE3